MRVLKFTKKSRNPHRLATVLGLVVTAACAFTLSQGKKLAFASVPIRSSKPMKPSVLKTCLRQIKTTWRNGTVTVNEKSVTYKTTTGKTGEIDFGMHLLGGECLLKVKPGELSTTILTTKSIAVTNGYKFAMNPPRLTAGKSVVFGYSFKSYQFNNELNPDKVISMCGNSNTLEAALLYPGFQGKPHMYVFAGSKHSTMYSYDIDGFSLCSNCVSGSQKITMIGDTVYMVSTGKRSFMAIKDAGSVNRRVFRIESLSKPLTLPLYIEQHTGYRLLVSGSGTNQIKVKLKGSREKEL